MAGTRVNILADVTARDDFLDAMVALDGAGSGINATDIAAFLNGNFPDLTIVGIEQELSYYDLFALWHWIAMEIETPVGSGRNAAHSGPVFLPWHRHFMILLEQWMQQVLGNPNFGLPYWDWAEDGELSQAQQWQSTLWTEDYLGESRNNLVSGKLGDLRVRIEQIGDGVLESIPERPLRRNAGRGRRPEFRWLPDKGDVTTALGESLYDFFPWSGATPGGHRNRLEGWITPPQLHNLVHVWVGGDMGPGTSPNDPVFFLNHCNVDRIWEAWMANNGRVYAPPAGVGPSGHRLNDAMFTLFGDSRTPADVLDPSPWYDYDSLVVD